MKGPDDKPTIGVLLCRTTNSTVIRYALEGIKSPIGVADYELAKALPKNLIKEFPTIKELETEIDRKVEKLERPLDRKLRSVKELLKGLKQESIREKKNATNIALIFAKVVLAIKKSITELVNNGLSEIFNDAQIQIQIESKIFESDSSAKKALKDFQYIRNMKIIFRASGIKQAGTKTFFISQDLDFLLEDYIYKISFDRNARDPFIEKLYHQLLDKNELNSVSEKFCELIVDYITEQLNSAK